MSVNKGYSECVKWAKGFSECVKWAKENGFRLYAEYEHNTMVYTFVIRRTTAVKWKITEEWLADTGSGIMPTLIPPDMWKEPPVLSPVYADGGFVTGEMIEGYSIAPAKTYNLVLEKLSKVFDLQQTAICPHCRAESALTSSGTLYEIIIELNDNHGWSREKVAGWLETIDAKITMKESK